MATPQTLAKRFIIFREMKWFMDNWGRCPTQGELTEIVSETYPDICLQVVGKIMHRLNGADGLSCAVKKYKVGRASDAGQENSNLASSIANGGPRPLYEVFK